MWASVTTIPSRVDKSLMFTLESMVRQDYPIDVIIVTIPTVNMRGMSFDLDMSDQELQAKFDRITQAQAKHVQRARRAGENVPDAPRIVMVRPDYDMGPIMKYFGVLEYIKAHNIPHSEAMSHMVWVGDDDKSYKPSLLRNRAEQHNDYCLKHNVTKHDVVITQAPKVRVSGFNELLGFMTVLLSAQSIYDSRDYVDKYMESRKLQRLEKCCAMNDDVLMGAALTNSNRQIVFASNNRSAVLTKQQPKVVDPLGATPSKIYDMMVCAHKHQSRTFAIVSVLASCILLTIVLLVMLFVRAFAVPNASVPAQV